MPGIGSRVYGAAAILLGGIALAWHDFAVIWQPVPDELASIRTLLAYAAGLVLVAAGAALVARRYQLPAALAVTAISLVFAVGWVRRIFLMPEVPGIWFGPAEQLSVVIGGVAIVAARRPSIRLAHGLRLLFGICLLAFGIVHFLSVRETAGMVPAWLPPGQRFWALATGVADVAAGLALLAGPFALLAARLATAMFAGFALLVWLPRVMAVPTQHVVWSGTAMTLAIAAATWVVADLIVRVPPPALFSRRG